MTDPRKPLRLFDRIESAIFLDRLNRFVVRCRRRSETVTAYLPNPGRLWELLLPGRTIYLEPADETTPKKHRWTAVAVEREGVPILLHTHCANRVVHRLIEDGALPEYRDVTAIMPEVKKGRSRFDFLLREGLRHRYLEVKSCTLAGKTIAMFPDAATERGARHIRELSHLAGDGERCGVLFLVHWPTARLFMPDYHTDLAFSRTLCEARHRIAVTACSVEWRPGIILGPIVRPLPIPWDLVEEESRDRGCFLILYRLSGGITIRGPSAKNASLPKGHYVYVGEADNNLTDLLKQRLRKRETSFDPLAQLRRSADRIRTAPIRTADSMKERIIEGLRSLGGRETPGFLTASSPSSGCCFSMTEDPLTNEGFVNLLIDWRINRLEAKISERTAPQGYD